jgi:very-short-patch-repair endonuclease
MASPIAMRTGSRCAHYPSASSRARAPSARSLPAPPGRGSRVPAVDDPETDRQERLGRDPPARLPGLRDSCGRLATDGHGRRPRDSGVASGATAGALYGLTPPPVRTEVIAARASRLPLPARVHTTASLPTCDVTTVDAIPATSPARTLIDLGSLLTRESFEDVLDTAIVQRLVRVDRLHTRASELWTPRRRGCSVVLDLLAARHPDLAHAANLWEARVLRIVRTLRLPDPRVNYGVRVGAKRRSLDLAWPDAKVAVEFDGFVPHSTRRVFDDDRARQNDLVADGWTVFRITKTMLDAEPVGTFRPIAAVGARNSPHTAKNARDWRGRAG